MMGLRNKQKSILPTLKTSIWIINSYFHQYQHKMHPNVENSVQINTGNIASIINKSYSSPVCLSSPPQIPNFSTFALTGNSYDFLMWICYNCTW